VEVSSRGRCQVCFYLCSVSEKQGSSPQALRTATTVTCFGEALAYGDHTFDFIVKLPKTSRGNDSICVFDDKLTKLAHFVACKKEVCAKEFAELYVDHVFCLHGLSCEFIADRDPRFTSAFWQEVTVLLGTRTVMSFSFHPQTDGQTEESIRLWRRTCDISSLWDYIIGILCCHV
jgi:hypothetical protein